MEPTQGQDVNQAIPSIAQQLRAEQPVTQPRDEAGRFVPERKPQPADALQPKYNHAVLSEQDIHERMLNFVKNDGTANEWSPDPVDPLKDPTAGVKDELAQPKAAEGPQAEAERKAAEEAAAAQQPQQDVIELDYEAPLFETTIKVDGGGDETLKLSLKDLQAGYMRQADYQRKTQEVAKMREEAQQSVKAEVDKVAQAYTQQLEATKMALIQLAAPELKDVNWSKLASDDPAEFVRLSARANDLKGTLQAIDGQIQQHRQKAEDEHKANLAKAVQESVETLQREIPGWNNELYASILKSGEEYGFKREELSQVYDARVIKLLHDAMKQRQLQQAKPEVSKKVVTVPKVVKPGATGGANPQAQVADNAANRLAKTGKWRDAAALLLARGIK